MTAENGQPITEDLKISFFLKVFCNWLFVFCSHGMAHYEVKDYDNPIFSSPVMGSN